MAFSALEALQAFGMGRRLAQEDRQQRRGEETRTNISRFVTAGDLGGAETAALAGGEYDVAGHISRLGENHRQQATQEARILGAVATRLRTIPADQRQSAYQRLAPPIAADRFQRSGAVGGRFVRCRAGRVYLVRHDNRAAPSRRGLHARPGANQVRCERATCRQRRAREPALLSPGARRAAGT